MDLQFVLDSYTCAVYVLSFLHNKGQRGIFLCKSVQFYKEEFSYLQNPFKHKVSMTYS